jgi:hypothetical protein
MPDTGVAHQNSCSRALSRLDHHRDCAGFAELDGVAGEIEQDLAKPRSISHHLAWQPVIDVGADLKALFLRARRYQLDRFLDERSQIEGPQI